MTKNELNDMTVLQLRKLAKENRIVLGAGIDKAGIVDKLSAVLCDQADSAAERELPAEQDRPAEQKPSAAQARPAEPERPAEQDRLAEPKYQAAWHNSDGPRFNARPAYQAPQAPGSRPAWQNTTPSGQHLTHEQQHAQPLRTGGFTPRFGPAAGRRKTRRRACLLDGNSF